MKNLILPFIVIFLSFACENNGIAIEKLSEIYVYKISDKYIKKCLTNTFAEQRALFLSVDPSVGLRVRSALIHDTCELSALFSGQVIMHAMPCTLYLLKYPSINMELWYFDTLSVPIGATFSFTSPYKLISICNKYMLLNYYWTYSSIKIDESIECIASFTSEQVAAPLIAGLRPDARAVAEGGAENWLYVNKGDFDKKERPFLLQMTFLNKNIIAKKNK